MKPLTDPSGKVLAYEHDATDYRKEIRTRSGALLAYYNPNDGPSGRTYDRSGKMVGSGDQRARFISDE